MLARDVTFLVSPHILLLMYCHVLTSCYLMKYYKHHFSKKDRKNNLNVRFQTKIDFIPFFLCEGKLTLNLTTSVWQREKYNSIVFMNPLKSMSNFMSNILWEILICALNAEVKKLNIDIFYRKFCIPSFRTLKSYIFKTKCLF